MEPLDKEVHYGIVDRNFLDVNPVQPELLPTKLNTLRWKLNQKAKNEPSFRFYALYDRMYRMDVLEAAFRHVGVRGKASGIDGVRAEEILDKEGETERFLLNIQEELKAKSYRPSPVKRVYIPKADGKKRPLGIPTLKDRVVQMAVYLILEPIFEADFLDCSHGFRCGRSAHDALAEIQSEIQAGRQAVYDADLKGYFDSIPHDKLMACVRVRIADNNVINLIRGWLNAPIIETDDDGKQQPPTPNTKGTPQGGVISPLLANIYLHWFDKCFHGKNAPFTWANARLIRYADDFVILARYQGLRIDEWVKQMLEDRFGLEINRTKTKVVRLDKNESLDFLGYTFRMDKDLHGREKRYLNLVPSNKTMKKAREAIREKTSPSKCYKPTPEVIEDINSYLKGWSNYFKVGYPRKAYRDICHFARQRMITHLNRRSQRKYHRPEEMTHYEYLHKIGLIRL